MRRALTAITLATVIAVAFGVAPAHAAKARPPGPVRVLLMGDSLTVSYQDEAALALRAKGYQVTGAGLGGTGLLDADHCRAARAKVLAKGRPDVVVIEYVGNYLANGHLPCAGPVYAPRSAEFYKAWKVEARRAARVFAVKGARVVWVEAPLAIRLGYNLTIPAVNAIYRSLGPTLNAAWPYSDATHVADGLHLSQAGQDRLAAQVVAVVG
jgi:lysophospholipase L1-like esterase